MSIEKFFDEKPLLSADAFLKKKTSLPQTIIVTWLENFKNCLKDPKPIWDFNAGIKTTVYLLDESKSIGYVNLASGSAIASAFLEESSCLGTKNYIFLGSCGSLTKNNAQLIVPDKALIGEGVSQYYLKDNSQAVEIKTADNTCSFLKKNNIPFTKGSTFSTDALYRETPSLIEQVKQKGCICIEMESSAIHAVSNFKNLNSYQFFFTADKLDSSKWQEGTIFSKSKKDFQVYFDIAFALASDISCK